MKHNAFQSCNGLQVQKSSKAFKPGCFSDIHCSILCTLCCCKHAQGHSITRMKELKKAYITSSETGMEIESNRMHGRICADIKRDFFEN